MAFSGIRRLQREDRVTYTTTDAYVDGRRKCGALEGHGEHFMT